MDITTSDSKAITDEMLDKMAEDYENGTWSGHGEITMGRPKLYDEDMETVSFRLPKSRIQAIEAVAKRRNESKSDFFREAIDKALLTA
jgi:hypothetical protein